MDEEWRWDRPDAADDARRNEVEAVIRVSIAWAEGKRLHLLYDALAQDGRLFIFHPDEDSTIRGFTAFRRMAEDVFMDPAFAAAGHEIRDLRIDFSRGGDIAWFSARLDDRGTWEGRPIGWENARWTGVLEQSDERWRIVQMHFSLPQCA